MTILFHEVTVSYENNVGGQNAKAVITGHIALRGKMNRIDYYTTFGVPKKIRIEK